MHAALIAWASDERRVLELAALVGILQLERHHEVRAVVMPRPLPRVALIHDLMMKPTGMRAVEVGGAQV